MPTNGFRKANAMACAALNPTSKAIGKPGPCVAATASSCSGCTPASRSAVCTTGIKFRRCSRAASSGTTPPYSACSLICEETALDKTLPSRTTAALVSSQEVSRARRVIFIVAARRQTANFSGKLQLTVLALRDAESRYVVLQRSYLILPPLFPVSAAGPRR